MSLRTVIDERLVTVPKVEALSVPASSPYTVRLGEVPDPAHGVEIRHISPVVKTGTGSGTIVSGGSYTGLTSRSYVVEIDTEGDIGTATYKWSNTNGVSWQGTLIPIADADPISIEFGLTVQAVAGSGQDFDLGDAFEFTADFWTELEYAPTNTREFQVDYVTGDVDFHSADLSKSVQATYEGRGSLVEAENINQLVNFLKAGAVVIQDVDTSDFSVLDVVSLGSGAYVAANATDGTKPAFGFVKTVDSEAGEIVTFGPMAGFAGLTPGAVYYLSTTDFEITASAPSGAGNAQQKVGRAMSTTVLFVRISDEVEIVS